MLLPPPCVIWCLALLAVYAFACLGSLLGSQFISPRRGRDARRITGFFSVNLSFCRKLERLQCFAAAAVNTIEVNANLSDVFPSKSIRVARNSHFSSKKWSIHSTAQSDGIVLTDEGRKTWEACREALSAFDLSVEEKDKILGKAFGHLHSPYWGEERKREIPNYALVNEILDYLRSLGLSNDDVYKLLKKFPEVLGCSLEHELRNNVKILQDKWGISGKQLRNLLLRNPKALGYNIDCKGDCMAQCTRCWARF